MRGLRLSAWAAAIAILAGIAAAVVSGPAASQGSNDWDGSRKVQPRSPGQKPQAKAQAPAAKAPTALAPEQTTQVAGKGGEEPPSTSAATRETDREDRAGSLERQLNEATVALTNQGLAVTYATIGLMVVTGGLWLMVFLQSRDLKAAVRAVHAASAAARSSNELMERAVTLTQRATVIVGEPRAVWLRDSADRLVGCRLLVTWHNVGNTPTRNMIAAVAGQATDKPPSQTSAFPQVNARQQPAAIGPNAAINSAYVNLPIGLVADVLGRRSYYLFAGWAEYNDVFDNTPRHRVEFCYWVEFEGDPAAEKLEAKFHIHGKHNRHCESAPAGDGRADGAGASAGPIIARPEPAAVARAAAV